jgi:hypothetical protein
MIKQKKKKKIAAVDHMPQNTRAAAANDVNTIWNGERLSHDTSAGRGGHYRQGGG